MPQFGTSQTPHEIGPAATRSKMAACDAPVLRAVDIVVLSSILSAFSGILSALERSIVRAL